MTNPDDATASADGSGTEQSLDETARIPRDLIRIDTTNWGEGRASAVFRNKQTPPFLIPNGVSIRNGSFHPLKCPRKGC